jgi:hypothetical protein
VRPTASNAANLVDILQADQILNLTDDSSIAVPHIIRTHLIRGAVLDLPYQSSGRKTSLADRRKSGQANELLRLFSVLHTWHEDTACTDIERESDEFRGVAGYTDERNHGTLRMVLNRADEINQEGCIKGSVFQWSG